MEVFLSYPFHLALRVLRKMSDQGLHADAETFRCVRELMYPPSALIGAPSLRITQIEPHVLLEALPAICGYSDNQNPLPSWLEGMFKVLPEHASKIETLSPLQRSLSKILGGKLPPLRIHGFCRQKDALLR